MTFFRDDNGNGMGRNIDGTGHDFVPPGPKPGGGGGGGNVGGGGTAALGGSPGLLTSTGGLFGFSGALLVPYFNVLLGRYFFKYFDTTDFDSEEDTEYDFRQEDVQDDRYINIHRVTITYREIGKCKFTVGVQAYSDVSDEYIFKETVVKIEPPKNSKEGRKDFPDNKLHTKKLSLKITGIRPQLYILRKGQAGPIAITKARMVGVADEKPEA